MEWKDYCEKFILVAIQAKVNETKFDEFYIQRCLDYANPLFIKQLPIIYDLKHLSLLVGYNLSYLLGVSNDAKSYYRFYKIPKKSGGERSISEPLPSLKEIQRWILDNILYKLPISKFAKGFVPGRSIRENARFHRNQKFVLSLDLENFFTSIKIYPVIQFFINLGYRISIAVLLAKICTLEGCLPQGAPTSPALSNLLSVNLDNKLSVFSHEHGIRYTRYADDLTFSGDFDPGQVIKFVRGVVSQEHLKLNEKKTRLMERHQRQEVTGVVVNNKLQAPRELRRNLRKVIYYIEKYGIHSHIDFTQNKKANYLYYLLGQANFIHFINKKDKDAIKAISILKTLLEN